MTKPTKAVKILILSNLEQFIKNVNRLTHKTFCPGMDLTPVQTPYQCLHNFSHDLYRLDQFSIQTHQQEEIHKNVSVHNCFYYLLISKTFLERRTRKFSFSL